MIILFDPLDAERRQDDQLDIYWISCGNEKLEDIPTPQTRTPPQKVAKRTSRRAKASTAATAPSQKLQKAKVSRKKETKMNPVRAPISRAPIARPKMVKKQIRQFPAIPDARCVPTTLIPRHVATAAAPMTGPLTGGRYVPMPVPMNHAIPTGPAVPYFPYWQIRGYIISLLSLYLEEWSRILYTHMLYDFPLWISNEFLYEFQWVSQWTIWIIQQHVTWVNYGDPLPVSSRKALSVFFFCVWIGRGCVPVFHHVIPLGQFHCTLLYPVYRRGCNFEIEREREYVIMTFDLFWNSVHHRMYHFLGEKTWSMISTHSVCRWTHWLWDSLGVHPEWSSFANLKHPHYRTEYIIVRGSAL